MIYISTLSLGSELEQCLDKGRFPEGFGVELGSSVHPSRTGALIELVKCNETTPVLIHHYFPAGKDGLVVNLASADAGIRQRSLDHCCKAMELCGQIGADFYSVHAGLAIDPDAKDLGRPLVTYKPIPMNHAKSIFSDSLELLSRKAQSLGVGLTVENNVLAGFNAPDGENNICLLCSGADLMVFSDEAPSGVGLLLDVGHLKVSAQTLGFDPVETVLAVANNVMAVHLHDNAGDTDRHAQFDEKAWFVPVLTHLREARMIIEAAGCSLKEIRAMATVVEKSLIHV